jgi:hypothetical protein
MATFIFDIDGTVVEYHTNNWLPGVKEKLIELHQAGHQIIFVTMRGPGRDSDQEWNWVNTVVLFDQLPFLPRILDCCSWPRILVDDANPQALSIATNSTTWIEQLK